jgi:hypothetical protein
MRSARSSARPQAVGFGGSLASVAAGRDDQIRPAARLQRAAHGVRMSGIGLSADEVDGAHEGEGGRPLGSLQPAFEHAHRHAQMGAKLRRSAQNGGCPAQNLHMHRGRHDGLLPRAKLTPIMAR